MSEVYHVTTHEIPLADIHVELADCRRVPAAYLGEPIQELARSMSEHGQLHAIGVRPSTEAERALTGCLYRYFPDLGGARRIAAARTLNRRTILCCIYTP